MKRLLAIFLLLTCSAAYGQSYTQMQWGMDKTVGPYNFGTNINGTWRNLGTVSSTGVWSIPATNLSFTQLGAGAVTRTLDAKTKEALSVPDFGVLGAATDAATYQAAINEINQLGGGQLHVPNGSTSNLISQVNLKKGTWIMGSAPAQPGDTNAPYLIGSRIQAGANVSALLGEASYAGLVHSMGIERMTINGNKGTYAVSDLVKWTPVNSHFMFNNVGNGTGNCVSHVNPTGGDPVWINWYMSNTIGSCDGVGLKYQGSDGRIAFNYLSSNGIDLEISGTSGATPIIGNNIDCAGGGGGGNCPVVPGSPAGNGIQITPSSYRAFMSPIVANFFVHNSNADIIYKNNGSLSTIYVSATGNVHHLTGGEGTGSAYKWETNTQGGVVVGDVFSYWTAPTGGACDIAFTDSTNQFVGIFGTQHDKSPANRFCNLPGDTQFITGGPGGAYNRLQSLILSSVTSAVSTQQTRLQVHGGDAVLGASGVMARFSNGINSPGYDAALLVGSAFGTTPYLNCVSGETTTAAACWFAFKNTVLMSLNDNGIAFSGPVKHSTYTIAGLPACSASLLGALATVSNGTAYATGTYGSAVSATGAVTRQVACTNTGGATTYAWAYN